MILAALAMLGFGITDLARWSPDRVERSRAAGAAASGTAAVVVVAGLSGMEGSAVLLTGITALTVLSLWSAYDLIPLKQAKPEYALALVVGAIVILVALSGSADPISGDVASWYSNLSFGFSSEISVDQFVLGVGASVFLLATGNRIVRFTLAATEASLLEGEGAMRGGRVIGPMERLIVAAAVVSGGVAGAGFVIAAKGLLRFREIRGEGQSGSADKADGAEPAKIDEITEYFLIGTFTSVLIASAVGVLVLAGA